MLRARSTINRLINRLINKVVGDPEAWRLITTLYVELCMGIVRNLLRGIVWVKVDDDCAEEQYIQNNRKNYEGV